MSSDFLYELPPIFFWSEEWLENSCSPFHLVHHLYALLQQQGRWESMEPGQRAMGTVKIRTFKLDTWNSSSLTVSCSSILWGLTWMWRFSQKDFPKARISLGTLDPADAPVLPSKCHQNWTTDFIFLLWGKFLWISSHSSSFSILY